MTRPLRPESPIRPPPIVSTAAAPAAGVRAGPPDGPSPFARLLEGLGREAQRGEATLRGAIGAGNAGRDLGPSELLALQSGIYRYSEVIDLAAKLVDRATNGIKTVVSGQ